MDLSSMLNGSASNKNNINNSKPPIPSRPPNGVAVKKELSSSLTNNPMNDKAPLYHLASAIQLAVAKDNTAIPPLPSQRVKHAAPPNGLSSSPFRPNDASDTNTISPKIKAPTAEPAVSSNAVEFNQSLCNNPGSWCPKLSLKLVMEDQPLILKPAKRAKFNNHTESESSNNLQVQLKPHEAFYRGDEPKVLLEDTYEVQGAYPRGFFVIMAKRNVLHNFVFQYPDNFWFEDLYGLRKSAYVHMRTAEGEVYELHLKPSRDKMYLFGYLMNQKDMLRLVKESMNEIIFQRKLPLVLDLDDTLVRIVGEGNERHVPEAELHKCQDRVAVLKDGRRVVLTERVHEFLEWAQNLYDISVCSLGDQPYVENVVNVLDPQRTWIRGILYSARSEHDYIKRSPDPGRPPKDLLALYSFCALKDKSFGSSFSLPLILDDETRMWPLDQHDNIIEVKCQSNVPVWSVSLFPIVQDTLAHVHQEFFRQFDPWYTRSMEAAQNGVDFTRQPPSAISIYKTYLRHILRDMIARPPRAQLPARPSV